MNVEVPRRCDSGVTDAHAEHFEDHDISDEALITHRIGCFLLCVVRAHSLSGVVYFNWCSFALFICSVGRLRSLRRL